MSEQIIVEIFNSIKVGDRDQVKRKVQAALDAGLPPDRILLEGMISAMAEVGRLFEAGEYFVPDMLVAARTMQEGLQIIKPLLAGTEVKPVGCVAIGTVKGDLHDIGKNLVAMMLEGAGFSTIDLGVDVQPDRFVETVRQGQVDVVAMSALLTTTMANMKATIEALITAGVREQVKVIVGGAPLTENYAKSIGADGYAEDASRAVRLVQAMINS
jgi:5-methyltetrahydrofolate--homocysteine methyltransferase